MPTSGHSYIFYKVPIIALISLIAATLLFANIFPANNKISVLGQIANAQTQPPQFPIRNVEFSTSPDKAGDPATVSIGPMMGSGCEVCSFIKYIPGVIGKAGVAYKSAQTLDLSGAKRIVFFAKGQLGGENVAFVAIGKPSTTSPVPPNIFSNLNFAVISKNVTLTKTWERYQLSLNVSSLTGVTDPFGFIVSKVRSQAPASSLNSPQPPLNDPSPNHIAFFLKGVTFDTNPAVNPISTAYVGDWQTTATPTKANTTTNSLNTTTPTTTNSLNTTTPTTTNSLNTTTPTTTNSLNTTTPTTTNSLNTTTPTTTATSTKAATTTNDTLKRGTGPIPSSTSSSNPTTNNNSTHTQGNASLTSSPQQPWHQWNESTTWTAAASPLTNGTYSKAVPITNNPTIPQTLAASSSTTSGRIANGGSIPIKTSTNQNVISSNASVSQNQHLPHVLLVPSQEQTQPSFSTSNSGQSSQIWQNPAGVQSQNQQQSQGSLVPFQQPKQSSLANTTLQHQYPYQSQAPYPYQSQAPYPYQSQATYQKQQTTANQPPIANAGISQTVTEATTTTLDGRASYSPIIGNGNIAAYQWTQLPTGIPVALTGANTATPTFTAPIVPTDNTLLVFSLRVMDNHGTVSTNPAIVYVMIKHNPNNSALTRGNIAGTIINQGQQQQAHTSNNIIGAPSQPNYAPSQIVSPNTLNAFPSRVR